MRANIIDTMGGSHKHCLCFPGVYVRQFLSAHRLIAEMSSLIFLNALSKSAGRKWK